MSEQAVLSFVAGPSPRRASTSTWKAYVERFCRYRVCVRLDLGRAWACEWPWEPGDSPTAERMGPERRPCPLCEVRRDVQDIIARAHRSERIAEEARIEAMPYLAWLESDRGLMRKVERAVRDQLGAFERWDTLTTALVMLREYGCAEAALEELQHEAYAMDADHFDVVRNYLGVMHMPKSAAEARLWRKTAWRKP